MQHFGKPFRHDTIHLLGGELGGGGVEFGGGAALGAFQYAEDELSQQRLIMDAQRVKITFHLGVSGIPLFQRTAGQLAGGIGQNRGVHGGLH